MNDALLQLAGTVAMSVLLIGALAAILTLSSRIPGVGRTVCDALARPPLLDLVIAMLTWIPWLISAVATGWIGFFGVIIGQAIVLHAWIIIHELFHRKAVRGPRIVKFINRRFGRWRNHLALWVTIIGLPVLWAIRLAQIVAYPPLTWLLRLPRYRSAEWVAVSRHKFEGLVGHDLIWCLYCDWMTGVYSLGAEMLRNIESFWCPIRFYEGKKCENCRMDFPDIEGGWVK